MIDESVRAPIAAVTEAALDVLFCLGQTDGRSEHWQTWNLLDDITAYVAEAPIVSDRETVVQRLRELERVAREAREAMGGGMLVLICFQWMAGRGARK